MNDLTFLSAAGQTNMVFLPLEFKFSPVCLHVCLDRGCIHGVQPDPAVHILPTRCPEEQQTHGRTTADTPAGNEFGPRPPGR